MNYTFRRRRELTSRMDFYKQRERRRKAEERLRTGAVPTLEEIADAENLIDVYRILKRDNGRGAGIDGVTYADLSNSEACSVLRQVSQMILNGTYEPQPGRLVYIPKSSGGKRKLRLPTIVDRVVGSALNRSLQGVWERLFMPNSFGFRPGTSSWHLLANLKCDVEQGERYWLASDDIQNAFDNVRLQAVMIDHAQHISDRKLLDLVNKILLAGAPKKTVGIEQGAPYSPTALNVHLHRHHDVYADKQEACWYRYADNLLYLAPTKQEANEARESMKEQLQRVGLTLKGQDGPAVDLRRATVEVLGFSVRVENGKLVLGLGSNAWTELEERLLEGHRAEEPGTHAQHVLRGWISAFGLAFTPGASMFMPRIQEVLVTLGYRETNTEGLEECMTQGVERWNDLYREVSIQRTTPAPSENTEAATAPPVASVPGS